MVESGEKMVRTAREAPHRTRNMHLRACSCAPRSRRRTTPACATASAPTRAIRRVVGAPGLHMRCPLGRGAAPRARSTSARRATRPRPLASVRIRLHMSGTRAHAPFRISVFWSKGKEEGRDRHTHPTALHVRQCTRKVNAGPIPEQRANDKSAIRHAQIGITRLGNRRKSARTVESTSGSSPYREKEARWEEKEVRKCARTLHRRPGTRQPDAQVRRGLAAHSRPGGPRERGARSRS